ncbi:SURF1 family protein [Compostimonas suwonensis]|uniref:SURF1-like protein n=1 Tax=Compostimonas suwonensis TaxID=1048394 RepID=A0A2M9BV89_9MICO|nr:SURF1 family cytochrome oxidase biogenesis protein [Compostimonas suwonensis]PJJ61862.1 SURF1 family protein [Compostimonas suwonensis]
MTWRNEGENPITDQLGQTPTLFRFMLRPRWIGLLLLTLLVAGIFAALSQWQLSRAIESGQEVVRTTEQVVPLESIAQPNGPIQTIATGQMVSVEGTLVASDVDVVANRINGGVSGYWVVGHVDTMTDADAAGPALAVAYGWTADRNAADAVARQLEASAGPQELVGRFLPSDSPEVPGDGVDPHEMTTMSVADLLNRWSNADDRDVYTGYVVSRDAAAGLEVIDSPAPDEEVTLNWLNIFYAVEWVVFAGFAFFLWYRLAKDGWEREQDERLQAEMAAHGVDVK